MTLGRQFDRALEIINSSEGVIKGRDATEVFKAANIRRWPNDWEHPAMRSGYASGVGENPGYVRHDETLHTTQGHLHAPTLRKYMAGDVPEFDADYDYDDIGPGSSDVRYNPEVIYDQPTGRQWVGEGHHRLVASRLRGDLDTDTWHSHLRR